MTTTENAMAKREKLNKDTYRITSSRGTVWIVTRSIGPRGWDAQTEDYRPSYAGDPTSGTGFRMHIRSLNEIS